MGFVYIRSVRTARREWRFVYTGTELAPFARAKALKLLEEERGLERALAACRAGEAYAGRKEDISKFKHRLRTKGEERERCEVLAREFARAASRPFELDVDDIVYFGMDEGISAGGGSGVRDNE
jgi:hypothetical protein